MMWLKGVSSDTTSKMEYCYKLYVMLYGLFIINIYIYFFES